MYLNYTVVWQPNLGRTSLPSQTLDPRKRTLIVRRLSAKARVINLSSFLELKRSEWRKRLQIFSSGPAPILVDTNAHFSISRDRNDPQKEILVYPSPTGKMHRIGIHYGGYPVPKLRMLRRPSVEARKRPSMVTQTACFLWPMAEQALFFNPAIRGLKKAKPYEIRSSTAGGGFAMFATRDIVRGERIAVDVPFMVFPENIMYMPGSDLTYEVSEELEQAFESMLPQDQKDFLALHDGDAPLFDLKSLLQDILRRISSR